MYFLKNRMQWIDLVLVDKNKSFPFHEDITLSLHWFKPFMLLSGGNSTFESFQGQCSWDVFLSHKSSHYWDFKIIPLFLLPFSSRSPGFRGSLGQTGYRWGNILVMCTRFIETIWIFKVFKVMDQFLPSILGFLLTKCFFLNFLKWDRFKRWLQSKKVNRRSRRSTNVLLVEGLDTKGGFIKNHISRLEKFLHNWVPHVVNNHIGGRSHINSELNFGLQFLLLFLK